MSEGGSVEERNLKDEISVKIQSKAKDVMCASLVMALCSSAMLQHPGAPSCGLAQTVPQSLMSTSTESPVLKPRLSHVFITNESACLAVSTLFSCWRPWDTPYSLVLSFCLFAILSFSQCPPPGLPYPSLACLCSPSFHHFFFCQASSCTHLAASVLTMSTCADACCLCLSFPVFAPFPTLLCLFISPPHSGSAGDIVPSLPCPCTVLLLFSALSVTQLSPAISSPGPTLVCSSICRSTSIGMATRRWRAPFRGACSGMAARTCRTCPSLCSTSL